MFDALWSLIAVPLGFLMQWCYELCNEILNLPIAYVFALFLFTLLSKVLLFPLSLNQQRNSARTQLFQPYMKEIQRKYAREPEKRQQEIKKLEEEYGYKATAGCLPLLIQFPILFGLIEVIYNPISYILRVPREVIAAFTQLVTVDQANLVQAGIIQLAKTDISVLKAVEVAGYTPGEIAGYAETIFNFDMSLGSINLWEKPTLTFSIMLLIPLFSVVTMIASNIITLYTSGQMKNANAGMIMTPLFMSILFAVFSFLYPAGFSLYWGFQNVIGIAQSFLLRKIVDPDKVKEQFEEERKRKKDAQKAKKILLIKNEETGELIEKVVSPSELSRIRIQRAREIDAIRYGDDPIDQQSLGDYIPTPEPKDELSTNRKKRKKLIGQGSSEQPKDGE